MIELNFLRYYFALDQIRYPTISEDDATILLLPARSQAINVNNSTSVAHYLSHPRQKLLC